MSIVIRKMFLPARSQLMLHMILYIGAPEKLTEPGTVDKTESYTEPGMVVDKTDSCTVS